MMIIQNGIDIMDKSRRKNDAFRERGFTLVEVMIAMAIAGIVVGAMYSTYAIQRRTHAVQQATSEMQQNVRAALVLLVGDLKMAGYNPTGIGDFGFRSSATFSNGATLTEAVTTSSTTLAFTSDLDGDGVIDEAAQDINGDTNFDMSEMEQITYRLNSNTLQRYSTIPSHEGWQIVAENIEAIHFDFLDEDNNIITPLSATNEDQVRTVQIALLARSEGIDRNQTAATYTVNVDVNGIQTQTQSWSFNDNFQRRMLVTSVKLRNMGLQ